MLELARVVAVNPATHSLDCLILRTNQRCPGVPLLMPSASSDTGASVLPVVDAPQGDERWNLPPSGGRIALAVLAPTAGGNWIAVGMMMPPQNSVLNRAGAQAVTRHASGAWHMIAPDGTMTIGHPSGATITLGPTLAAPDPNGADAQGGWQPGPNGGAAPGLKVAMPSGATVTIAADGKVTIKAIGTLAVDAPKATFTGDVEAQGDVKAGSISLRGHRHGGVQGGAGQTGTPG